MTEPMPAEPSRWSASAVRRRRMSRQRLTSGVRWTLVVLALAGAAAAMIIDGPSPTGHAAVDLVERGAFVALMVVAGSRARRWSHVVAAMLVGVASSGWWIAVAAAAMVIAAVLVLPNRRDRVASAVSGGLIGLAALHLTADWFPRASLAVGAVATACVLASAWRHVDRSVRRGWKIAIGLAAVVVLFVGGVAAYTVLRVQDGLTRAATETRTGVSLLRQGRAGEAATTFSSAARRFDDAHVLLDADWLLPARLVPVLSQNLGVVRDVSGVGAELTASAAANTAAVDYDAIRRPDGGIDLDVVRSFREPVVDAARTLHRATDVLDAHDSVWLVGPLVERFDEFRVRVKALNHEAEIAELAVTKGPALLGARLPRRYLVLLGNPAEARDLGGHIGNWAELVADEGKLDLVEVGGPLDLIPPGDAAEIDPGRYPPSLNEMRPARFPQNWGSSPDLPLVARLSAELFESATGRPLDGVVYADPKAFAAFVGIVGPVDVPGLAGYRLTSENAAEFLVADQYRLFPEEGSGNDALEEVIRVVFDRLTSVRLPGPRALADVFAPLTHQGRFQMATLRVRDEPLLTSLDLLGRVEAIRGRDLLGMLTRNANPSKIDRYLHRTMKAVVRWNPETGEVGSVVTVELRNDAPTTGPDVVVGNQSGLPPGSNQTDLMLLTPFELLRSSVDGRPAEARTTWDGGYWRHQVRAVIPPGRSVVITYELEGLVEVGPVYRMRTVGQPLVHTDRATVEIVPTSGRLRPVRGARLGADRATSSFSATRDRTLRFVVDP